MIIPMIAFLSGNIKDRQESEIILCVGQSQFGMVGYQVRIPDHARYSHWLTGTQVEVFVQTIVREDAFDLFGFQTPEERLMFNTLMSASGVGPKMALSLLAHTAPENLAQMILEENKTALTEISGVGKKTAERMIVELKDVIEKKIKRGDLKMNQGTMVRESHRPTFAMDEVFIESYLALQSLGFKEIQAKDAVQKALLEMKVEERNVGDVVKKALQLTSGGK